MTQTTARLGFLAAFLLLLPHSAPPLSAEISGDALVGAWLFDEGDGLVAKNEVSDGESGVLTSPTWIRGRFGHALQFNGLDQFLRIRHDPVLDPRENDFSMTLWLRPEGRNEARVIWKDDGAPGALHRGYFLIQTGKNPRFAAYFGDGTRQTESLPQGEIELGEWHHVAVVRDVSANRLRLFINGELLSEKEGFAQDVRFEKDLCLGGRPGTSEMFHGAMDEVAMFRTALTENDVHQIMNRGLQGVLKFSGATQLESKGSQEASKKRKNFPLVVVAHDGTGDFGPDTPGTRTAGIQEAIQHCAEQQRDLYIRGGPGAVYRVSETIQVLAVNDFAIDGSDYTIEWTGPSDQDLLHVNSGLDAHYTFDTLVYGGSAAAVRLLPDELSNVDRADVFIDSELHVRTVRARGHHRGTGIAFQPFGQSIGHADFHFGEIDGFAVGLDIQDSVAAARGVNLSRIVCERIHTWRSDAVLIRVGKAAFQNTIVAGLEVDEGARGVVGIDMHGDGHIVEANLMSSFDTGSAVILRPTADDNQIRLNGNLQTDPIRLVSDRAISASNRITSDTLAIRPRTVPLSTHEVSHIQRLYPARARLRGGSVSKVELIRNDTRVEFDHRHSIPLDVGDELRIVSAGTPTLRIQPRPPVDHSHFYRAPAGVQTRPRRMTEEELANAVTVSWDGTGDFGAETYGTSTSGWQEAIDFAIAHKRNIYVKGGWGGRTKGYSIHDTIRIPAAESFHIEGGEYTLGYSGPRDQDLFVIDSGINCYYQFGLVGNRGTGAAIRVQPRSKLPGGTGPVFKNSVIRATSIGQAGPEDPQHYVGIGGIVFDTTHGPIVHNEFFASAPMSSPRVFTCGMQGHEFAYNILRASHTHSEAFIPDIVLLTVGPKCRDNIFDTAVSVNYGPVDHAFGVRMHGIRNHLDILYSGGIAPGKVVVFEKDAEANTLNFRAPFGVDPATLVTDHAQSATNRVIFPGKARPIHYVDLDRSQTHYMQRGQPATVRLVKLPEDGYLKLKVRRRGEPPEPERENDSRFTSPTSWFHLDVGDQLAWSDRDFPVQLLVIPHAIEFRAQDRQHLWSP